MSMEIPHDGPAAPSAAPAAAPEEDQVIDDVPTAVRDAAKRAFALRDRAAVVLELVSDSLLDDAAHEGPRELRFGARDQPATVTVRVQERAEGTLLHLETGPAQVLEVQLGDDVLEVQDAGSGQWTAPVRGHGLLSVVVEAGHQRARTAWLRI
jgi:hypothetical protein